MTGASNALHCSRTLQDRKPWEIHTFLALERIPASESFVDFKLFQPEKYSFVQKFRFGFRVEGLGLEGDLRV